jgi:hypothetical protein
MTTPRQPFSWDEDREERPVPLEGASEGLSPVARDIAAEAEDLVRASQEAIAREDTEPVMPIVNIPHGESVAAFAPSPIGSHGSRLHAGPNRKAIAAVVLACCLAFIHGWDQGSHVVASANGHPRGEETL